MLIQSVIQVLLGILLLIHVTTTKYVTRLHHILPFEEDFDSEYDYTSEEYGYLSLLDIQNAVLHENQVFQFSENQKLIAKDTNKRVKRQGRSTHSTAATPSVPTTSTAATTMVISMVTINTTSGNSFSESYTKKITNSSSTLGSMLMDCNSTNCGSTMKSRKKNRSGSSSKEKRGNRKRNRHRGRGSPHIGDCVEDGSSILKSTTKSTQHETRTKRTKNPKRGSESSSNSDSKEKRMKKIRMNKDRN